MNKLPKPEAIGRALARADVVSHAFRLDAPNADQAALIVLAAGYRSLLADGAGPHVAAIVQGLVDRIVRLEATREREAISADIPKIVLTL